MYIITAKTEWIDLGAIAERFAGSGNSGGIGGLFKEQLIKKLKSPDNNIVKKALPTIFGFFSDTVTTVAADYLRTGGWGIKPTGVELTADKGGDSYSLTVTIDESIEYGRLLKKTINLTGAKISEKNEFFGRLLRQIDKLSEEQIDLIMNISDSDWKYSLLSLLTDEYADKIIEFINSTLAKNGFAVTVGNVSLSRSENLDTDII